jgi:hypothetical protein
MMKESVADLHARHPYDKDERYWDHYLSLDEAIAAAGDLHTQDDPLTYLDTLKESDSRRAHAINKALLFLPPQVVIDSLGDEIGLWTSLSTSLQRENDAINSALHDSRGYNITDLEIARGWNWRKSSFSSSVKPILAQYGLMQAMRDGITEQVDLPAILQNSAKPGIVLSASRIDDYSTIPIEADEYNSYYDGGSVKGWGEDEDKKIKYTSWIDTPTGFALTYKGAPNAMAGLAMNGLSEIMIHQLQGVQARKIDPTKSYYSGERIVGKVSSRGLMPIDWQKVMVAINEQVAQSMDLPRVGIQAAKNNVWTKKRLPRDEEPHLPIDRAIKAYDEPAERLGYARDIDKREDWHKEL